MASTQVPSPPEALHFTLWAVQILLAAAFGTAGVMKSTLPVPDLAQQLVWPGAVPAALVRFIGIAELAAALGMVLPAALRIKPVLTPLAGLGLVLVMVLASGFHVLRGELFALPVTIGLGVLAGFVAWGRLRRAPVSAG